MIRKFFAALGCAVLGAAVMLLALPLLPGQLLPHGRAETLAATETETAPAEPADEPFDGAVTLRVLVDGAVREQTLHDYLVCVLLAEVPSGFAAEALKAQACAARTFALRQAGAGKHAEADVCASAACCQGWCAPEQWPEHAAAEAAVTETDGLAVVYDGQLIDATYFSCSGGRTEAAVAVWGGEIPYLQSVPSPGEEDAPRETETLTFTAEEFRDRITPARPDADLSGTPETWFGAVRYTEGGGIGTLELGGASFTGTELRRLLGLRSTDIEFSPQEDGVTVTTHGFGHRVGLSQYGAEAMAQAGRRFDEILLHYYQGTEIRRLTLDGEK